MIKLADNNCCSFSRDPLRMRMMAQCIILPARSFALLFVIIEFTMGIFYVQCENANARYGFVFGKHSVQMFVFAMNFETARGCILCELYFVLRAIKFHFLHSK